MEAIEVMETIEVMEAMEAIEVVEAIITEAVWALIVNGSLKALDLDSFASEARKPPAGLASRSGAAGAETGLRVAVYLNFPAQNLKKNWIFEQKPKENIQVFLKTIYCDFFVHFLA